MITSYVTPQRTMLYLSLVGPLDTESAEALVREYVERRLPGIRRCILDLGSVDVADADGLQVLHRLSRRAAEDRMELSVVAGATNQTAAIGHAAHRCRVPVVDGRNLPLAGATSGYVRPTPAAS